MSMTEEELTAHRKVAAAAVERAKAVLKPGDRVLRRICGGRRGTFRFTHWDGIWACGKTVMDCHPIDIYRVNGKDVDFARGGPKGNA